MLNSCVLGSSQEAYQMAQRYVQGYGNVWELLDIVAFNFGLIYDSVVNTLNAIIEYAGNPAGQTNTKYLMLGYGLGNIFYLIFFAA